MPNDLPASHTVYGEAQRWLWSGCFEMLVEDLSAARRLAQGRTEEPSAPVLDSRTPRSTPESGAGAAWDGHKQTRGSKPHLPVDTLAHLLALHVTPADADAPPLGWLASAASPVTTSASQQR